ncbi:aldolase/citrate lyase family protein [Pedococcus ginsenosidimutans]|uniref:Aldolase/citrate lyase family protein n=1 Tax=Pedococcus ginsenosidimutans TaxID=490570 RepID=A0ABP8XQS7_9MICO
MTARTTFDATALTDEIDVHLAQADALLAKGFPGERAERQPVHTVYVPADRYDADLVPRWGKEALAAMDEHAGSAAEYAAVLGLPVHLADEVVTRVRAKLASEPVEDLRIDLEDGYGARDDDEEDGAVDEAAAALLASLDAGDAAPFTGIRFKSFEAPTRARGVRSLARFIEAVTVDGRLPDGFVVTLPKVTSVDQVEAMVLACERLESGLGLRSGAMSFEIQVETPQSILGPDGTALVARMVHSAAGRCTGLHYGTYDYSASCGIAAAYQSMEHPAADHAKAVMQVAAAGTGVRLSDGSTNVLPVGDRDRVHAAWALHARLVRRSLERGYYQGWDLHPAQLPSRYAATYAFYREGLPAAAERLRNYVGSLESGVMDEPATARALADFVVRGLDCGAVDADEVEALTGIDRARMDVLARRAK